MRIATAALPRQLAETLPAPRPRIAGVGSALPPHRYPQATITAALRQYWQAKLVRPEVLEGLHARTGVEHRHLAFPLERYAGFSSWGETNAAWMEAAQALGAEAIDAALAAAGLSRRELDALYVVSITGIASPSLDARLINRMGLRPDIKRTPIFGVGCAGGAVGLSRATDHVLAYPDQAAALLAVELCSLTFQHDDLSIANLISTGLFGDGAAAAVVVGAEHRAGRGSGPGGAGSAPRVLASRSSFYPDSEDVMGWAVSEAGFRVVLSPRLPEVIRGHLARDVDRFLADHGRSRAEIGRWVIHTGGPKVLSAIQQALGLTQADLARSWDSLRRFGNLSSASVLLVLEDVVGNHAPPPGTPGMLIALGPGFCAEMLLLEW